MKPPSKNTQKILEDKSEKMEEKGIREEIITNIYRRHIDFKNERNPRRSTVKRENRGAWAMTWATRRQTERSCLINESCPSQTKKRQVATGEHLEPPESRNVTIKRFLK